jgi:glycosyltransferase involved in cell wall biosynthesis
MSNFKVSIVIPTFNRKDYLKDAIDSCLRQTIQCEIIVCDHGSTDGTAEFMANFYSDSVVYIRRDDDYGPHFCWLDGIIHSKGVYVHLQYDDDWIKPNYIEECLKLYQSDVGFVFSSAEVFNQKDGVIGNVLFSDFGETGVYPKRKFERFLLSSLVSPGAILIRKNDALDALYQGRLPLQKESYHGVGPDCLYSLLPLLRYKKVGYIKEPLVVFRSHENSITVNASGTEKRNHSLVLSYNEVRKFYLHMKFCKISRVHFFMQVFYPMTYVKRIYLKLPSFLKLSIKKYF